MDTDKNKVISLNELKKSLFLQHCSENEIQQIWDNMDTSQDGKVDFQVSGEVVMRKSVNINSFSCVGPHLCLLYHHPYNGVEVFLRCCFSGAVVVLCMYGRGIVGCCGAGTVCCCGAGGAKTLCDAELSGLLWGAVMLCYVAQAVLVLQCAVVLC
jgi:hypothetical protein